MLQPDTPDRYWLACSDSAASKQAVSVTHNVTDIQLYFPILNNRFCGLAVILAWYLYQPSLITNLLVYSWSQRLYQAIPTCCLSLRIIAAAFRHFYQLIFRSWSVSSCSYRFSWFRSVVSARGSRRVDCFVVRSPVKHGLPGHSSSSSSTGRRHLVVGWSCSHPV